MSLREVVCLEGNIAVGKSTVLEALRQVLPGPVTLVPEPVQAWDDCGALHGYYNQQLSALAFQQLALVTRDAAWRRGAAAGAPMMVCERSVESDRGVFADALLNTTSRSVYETTYQHLTYARPATPTFTVLLDVPRGELERRLRLRARASETKTSSGVTYELLDVLDAAHEQYFSRVAPRDRARVDAAAPPGEVAKRIAIEVSRWQARRPSTPPW